MVLKAAHRGAGVLGFTRLRRAVPAGGRRSKPSPRSSSFGLAPFARLRRAVPAGGRRSKPPPRSSSFNSAPFARLRRAVPAGGRRSRPSPRSSSFGLAPFTRTTAGGAGRRPAFQAVPALFLLRLGAVRPPPAGASGRRALRAGGGTARGSGGGFPGGPTAFRGWHLAKVCRAAGVRPSMGSVGDC